LFISKRDTAIDCLRGFSILAVLATHGVLPALPEGRVAQFFSKAWANGYYGVIVFFVISGFLITSTAIERYGQLDRIHPKDFYTRRFARIAPSLLLVLVLACILHLAGSSSFVTGDPAIFWKGVVNALYFQFNWFFATGGYVPGTYPLGPLWSLSVEEVFYAGFPIVCLVAGRMSAITSGLVAVIVIAFLYRRGPPDFYLFAGTADGIAFGCLAAILARRLADIRHRALLGRLMRYLGLAVLAFVFVKARAQGYHSRTLSFVALGAAVFLLGNAISQPRLSLKLGMLVWLPLSFVGLISYELYLFHMPLKLFADDAGLFAQPDRTSSFVRFAILVAICVLVHFVFSEPIRKLITRNSRMTRATLAPQLAAQEL
jgi:peptidoglycan/LPS O-acetylase OafA/YrhL